MEFQFWIDANVFSNTETPILTFKAAHKIFGADNSKQASKKDEGDSMSLKRPRKIEANISDHRRIGPGELTTLLPGKASSERTRRIDDRSN